MQVNFTLGGVLVHAIELYATDDGDSGELRCRLTDHSGPIYNDDDFMEDLRCELRALGFTAERGSIEYTEQGMQDIDSVSIEVDAKFVTEYRKISGEAVAPITD